jgi:hypothetical protein
VEITMPELLQGKATVIKTKDYLSTKEYVEPFIDEMSKITSRFKITIKLPDQMTMGATHDITYNRVLIEAILPSDHSIDKHDEVIGFLYGLDVRKPVAKIYRGYLNQACTNLTVFNPKWIEVQEIKPKESIKMVAKQLLESGSDFEQKIKLLKNTFVDPTTLDARLGKWVRMTLEDSYYNGIQNVRMSPNLPIEAYKSLYVDTASEYYVPPTKQASMFEVYNAFTQVITDDDKDFINKFEKTMMVNKLLEVK